MDDQAHSKVLYKIFPAAWDSTNKFCMAGLSGGYVCTRPQGHGGVHVAHIRSDGIVFIEGEDGPND